MKKKRIKEGDKILNFSTSKNPQEQKFMRIKINRYILDHNNNYHSKNSKHFFINSEKKMNNINSYFTPKLKRFKNNKSNNYLSALKSVYENSIKSSIINLNRFSLIQKKIKILEDKEKKDIVSKLHTKELTKKLNKTKAENIKQKLLMQNYKILKEKEENERKIIVKNLKAKNDIRIDKSKKERNMNNEKIAKENKILKIRRLNDALNEKNKIREENLKKKDLIKKIDAEISRRKEQSERLKNKILIEQILKEIKLEEELNRKILKKIKQYEKIGLNFVEK